MIAVVGGLLGWQVVRTAVVTSDATRTTVGPRLWASHPAVLTDRTMAEIGARAAHGQSPLPDTLRQVDEIARNAPLAPEPFLIKGAVAQVRQHQELAEQLFTAARTREPRSVAARYFLADRYLRTGRIEPALREMAALSRLFPEARAQFAPALSAYARTPGTVPMLRSFFRSSPEFEPQVLTELASDPRNTDLILALWGRHDRPFDDEALRWKVTLVNKLVEQGDLGKAYLTWRLLAGVNDSRGTVFNSGFAKESAPPPFNWTFASTGGVVEPRPGNRLEVIYFGRNDSNLAEQLLLLTPGRYRMSMEISEPPGKGGDIAWTLTCQPGKEPFFRLPLDRKGGVAGSFVIPQGCAAQRLQLMGLIGEFPESQDFTIGRFNLTKVSGP